VAHCALVAAAAHKWQIAADIASAVPAGKVASLAGKELSAMARGGIAAGQWHLAFGSGLYSAVHGEGNGVALASAGYGAVIADLAKEGSTFIPVVGGIVAAASVANDIFGSEEYKACRKGQAE
jgi:hypothetical protein